MKINHSVTCEYRTRSGDKAIIADYETYFSTPTGYKGVICAPDGSWAKAWGWDLSGLTVPATDRPHAEDIVDYWEELEPKLPKIDWSKYPDYVKYISRDEDGDVFWHTDAPEKQAGYYCVNSDEHPFGLTLSFPENLEPDMGDRPWEDSLVERPRVSFSVFIPWDKIPKEYSVIAWDSFEGWVAYKYIPRPLTCGEFSRAARNVLQDDNLAWCCLSQLGISLPDPYCSKESIFIRPGTNPIKDFDSDE